MATAGAAINFSRSYVKPVGERVETDSPHRVPGDNKNSWVGNDKPGRRQLQPHSGSCIIGDGFVRPGETIKQGVLSDTKLSTTLYTSTARRDQPDEPVWRSSIAAAPIADAADEEDLLATTKEIHDARRVRVNQSRDLDYYKQSPPY